MNGDGKGKWFPYHHNLVTAKSADSLKLEVLIKLEALLITMAWIITIIRYFDIFLWSNILNFALDINILVLPRNKQVWEECWCGGWVMLPQVLFPFLSCLLYVHMRSFRRNAFFQLPRSPGSPNHHISKAVLFKGSEIYFYKCYCPNLSLHFYYVDFTQKKILEDVGFFPYGSVSTL